MGLKRRLGNISCFTPERLIHFSGARSTPSTISKTMMKVGVEKLTWKYVDRKGQLHGPFDTMQMQEWHWRGWLSDDLQLSFGELEGFRPLRAVFPDPSTAFNSPPHGQ